MAYSLKLNTILIQIPKSGSQSLYYSLNREDGNLKYCGHLTLGQIFQEDVQDNPKVVAVIRDPIDRLVSALNYSTQNKREDPDPYSIIDYTLDTKCRIHYQPQSRFLHYNNKRDYTLKLFKFEDIDKAVAEFGWSEPAPKHNVSPKKYSRAQILKYPRIEEVMDFYKEDYKLREQLTKDS